jgi:hypothetical protein
VSFRFSAGTLDSMAGVYAPPKKYRLGSGGGKGKQGKAAGRVPAFAVASAEARPSPVANGNWPSSQAKHAFGAGSHSAVSARAIFAMERTARRVPEVMVRITGRQHGVGHVLANFTYISRLGHGADKELDLYTSDGDVLRDGRDMQILAQDWQEWEMAGDARRKGSTSISMILSMPAGTDPERLKDAALDFAAQEFANRSWVAALHVDRDHPHVHVTFARRDHDGRSFHPDRDDLFRYRQRFAEKLRDRGIDANATPAKARAIDPSHEPIAARKLREKGQVPRIDKSRGDRAQQFRDRGVPDPVHAVLANQRATVLMAYERSIGELSSSPSLADQVIARSLEKFVASILVNEPNSTRAMRGDSVELDKRDHPEPLFGQEPPGVGTVDPVAASLAKAQALRDQIMQGQAERDQRSRDSIQATLKPENDASADMAERLRALKDRAQAESTHDVQRSMDDILRRVQELDRERRERDRDRDRTKDRDGPAR